MPVRERTVQCPNIFAAFLKKIHSSIQVKVPATKIHPAQREYAEIFLTQALHPTTMKGKSSPYFRTLQLASAIYGIHLRLGASEKLGCFWFSTLYPVWTDFNALESCFSIKLTEYCCPKSYGHPFPEDATRSRWVIAPPFSSPAAQVAAPSFPDLMAIQLIRACFLSTPEMPVPERKQEIEHMELVLNIFVSWKNGED